MSAFLPRRSTRGQGGFTLLETVVTLVVVSMLVAMSSTWKLIAVWSALLPSGFGNSASVLPPTT